MNNWIPLDPNDLNQGREERRNGVVLRVFVSPHDVPISVRGGYDDKADRFVIEFKYVADEPTSREKVQEHISALVGKHSRRIYSLIVDIKRMGATEINLELLTAALGSLAREEHFRSKQENFKVVLDAIRKNQQPLLSGQHP